MTTPTTTCTEKPLSQRHGQSPALPRGRLIFALDATASRAPTWAIARELQAKMFGETAPLGVLSVQLVYYRANECCASRWATSGAELAQFMGRIECQAGETQIARVLRHALRETEKKPVQAVIFVGDAMEEELDALAPLATKLGELRTPLYMFQEARDPVARKAFRLLALKSGGAYSEFNPRASKAVEQLSNRLNAIARLAVGDTKALQRIGATAQTNQRRKD